ncbi:uncharacterized protein M437DRAFT_63519 [Aureobasidium melanogenum CBS 110374]|uniref:Uncharacterized protein n=1 Tax=Aureobasidium melanogenum (strain CBS 110374) TaxID=1043003 RepID=A0A074W7T7_AURM1|nr:uncharacterized protein M437DRAFT_63519 [Aureobasidium melanogenum CBS 110374]KEQ65987.1 hypothetical protein M437DRAFT_63519 [Aureobasidium melanogenum CBS 110374]
MTTSMAFFALLLCLLSTTFPILAHATTTNPSRKHSILPHLLCLDSGYCVPKTMSTPSLDLDNHIKLDVAGQASSMPQSGGAMLDRHVVFAVRIAEPADNPYAKRLKTL